MRGRRTRNLGGRLPRRICTLWACQGDRYSSRKRLALLRALHLPEHMSTNAMLQALNLLYTRQELEGLLEVEG